MSKQVAVTVVSVMVIVIGTAVMWRGQDRQTAASRDALLVRHELPTDLPPLFNSASEPGDAAKEYEAAIDLFVEHEEELRRDPPQEVLKQLADRIGAGAAKQSVSPGFLDDCVPMTPGGKVSYGSAPARIASLTLDSVRQASPDVADATARKVFVYGRRLFENNVRVSPRRDGLIVMATAALFLENRLEPGSDERRAVTRWIDAISAIQQAWDEKLKGMYQMDASAGDLIRIANLDGDLGFRIEALLRLGIAQYLTDSRANRRAIHDALDANITSDHELLAQAAQAARALSREQVRQVR